MQPLHVFAYCPRGEGRGSFRLWRFRGLDPSSRFARTPLPSAEADRPTTPWETHRPRRAGATGGKCSGRGRGLSRDSQARLTGNWRLWITFWRRFWRVFLGGFLEATGPGASVRGDFSADGVLLVRWASANFDFFRGFFTFLGRFLPVFGPFFALFPSMSCAYLYVNNYFSASLAWKLHSLQPRRAGVRTWVNRKACPESRRAGIEGTQRGEGGDRKSVV